MALDFAAGCLGGCAGVIVGHPLDTVKVRLQTQDINNPKYKGTFHCLQSTVTKEGFRGIFKGMSSPLMGVAAINAIVFGVYGNAQRQMPNPDSLMTHAIAGASAGFFQSFLCSPMELAKSRMQVGDTSRNPLECLKRIYLRAGFKGVFRGLGLTVTREIPAFGSYFLTYELLTRTENGMPVSTMSMLVAGGMAGVVSWTIVYPVDVIKSRMQIDGMKTTKYSTSFHCVKEGISTEGYSFLFRGLSPALIRAFPVNAATFAVVTWSMRILGGDGISDTEILWEKCTDAVYNLHVTEPAHA